MRPPRFYKEEEIKQEQDLNTGYCPPLTWFQRLLQWIKRFIDKLPPIW